MQADKIDKASLPHGLVPILKKSPELIIENVQK